MVNGGSDENIENIVKSPEREHFTKNVRSRSLERQPRCPLFGNRNKTIGGANCFDYDHKNNDKTNGSENNCNPISLQAHRLKSKCPEYYNSLINSDNKVINEEGHKELLLNNIKDLINGVIHFYGNDESFIQHLHTQVSKEVLKGGN